MSYKYIYKTRENLSDIILNSVEKYLTGLWFENSKYVLKHKSDCIFKDISKQLDIYFSGKNPDFIPKYKVEDITPFRSEVIKIMNTIPFGKTINDIAKCT